VILWHIICVIQNMLYINDKFSHNWKLKGGGKLKNLVSGVSRALFMCAFLCVIVFVSSQLNLAVAAKGGPCPKKQNEKLYWCTECKEVFTWNECGNLKYIWDTKKHKAGEEVATHKMVPTWACLRTAYSCVNDKCENSKACYAFNIGFCELCNDDLTPKKSRAKLNFACKKCNKEYDEPGVGHQIDEKQEYAEHLISFGNCEHCGEALEAVCKQSGTCPHEPDF